MNKMIEELNEELLAKHKRFCKCHGMYRNVHIMQLRDEVYSDPVKFKEYCDAFPPAPNPLTEVSEERFHEFRRNYPNSLVEHGSNICDPPVRVWMDGTKMVARVWLRTGWPMPDYTSTGKKYDTDQFEILI